MQFRVARCVSVTLLLMANVVSAPLPRAAPFDAVAVDQFIATQMARHRIPGLAVAITRGDQVVHIRGYGEAHDGQPVTGQTLFRIASLSKSLLPWPCCNLLKSAKLRLMRRSSATCQTSIWQPPRRLNRLGPLVDEQSAVAGGARRPKCCLKARASKPSPAIKVVNLLVSHSSLNTNSLSVAYRADERGSCDNANRRLREFFPRGVSMDSYTDDYVAEVQDIINRRPRKILNGLTPDEIHFAALGSPTVGT